MKSEQINGLLVQADDLFIREGKRIVELAAAYKTIYRIGEQAAAGGLQISAVLSRVPHWRY